MLEFLSNHLDILANFITIVGPILYGITWSHRSLKKELRGEINDLKMETRSNFDKLRSNFDKLSDEVRDIDRRLCRIEGALSNKECCMLKDPRLNEKIE